MLFKHVVIVLRSKLGRRVTELGSDRHSNTRCGMDNMLGKSDLVPGMFAGALVDALKRYDGKLPVVVKLFVQVGAKVGEGYTGVMRADIVVPALDKEQLVV